MVIKREFEDINNILSENGILEFVYDTSDRSILELYTGMSGIDDEDRTFYKKMLNEETVVWELMSFLR